MSVLAVAPAMAVATPTASSVTVTGPVEAPDAATASALAYRNRKPVEILRERTELSQTFAQPDGTLRTKQFARPQWVRQGPGWTTVDTNLQHVDGAVAPKATTLEMRFSGGGSGPLLTIADGGRNLALSWATALPAPVLDGSTATYTNVLPGVDLRMTAAVDSYSEVLVVKTAAAAQNPALAKLRFGLTLNGVAVSQDADGFIKAVDPAGDPIFVSDGARMWESPNPATSTSRAPAASSAAPSAMLKDNTTGAAAGPDNVVPDTARTEHIPVYLSQEALTVVPSADMLLDASTRFPLYIDPGFNGGKEIWTHVSRKNPTKSYWTDSNRDTMRVGQSWGSSSDDDWRTIVQFNITALKDTQIRSASLLTNVWHSANCTPSPLQLWRTNAISKTNAVTWNSTKNKWWKKLAQVNATANKHACPKGNDEVEFGQTILRTEFQLAAKAGSSSITFAFRAKSESDQYQWKKLVADSTYLDLVYNRLPAKPTGLKLGPCYLACSSPAATSSDKPKLTMAASDADGGTLRYEYEVYDSAKKVQKAKSGTAVTGVKSGTSRNWVVTKTLADGQYYWRGRACDTYICGDYSVWFAFKVDTSDPTKPSVYSAKYPPTDWNGGPGVPGTFTFKPGTTLDGVKKYIYTLNGSTAVEVVPGSDGVGSKTITPVRDLRNVLKVHAIDGSGNQSGDANYEFNVSPVGDSWHWSLNEGSGTTAASAPDNNRPVSVAGTGVTWNQNGKQGESSAAFTGDGELTTQVPVVDTLSDAGFSVAAWVRLPGVAADDADSFPGDTDPSTGEPADGGPGADGPEDGTDPVDSPNVPLPEQSLPEHNQTVVSQDGVHASMFRLGFRNDIDVDNDQKPDPAWCFSVSSADVVGAPQSTACTPEFVVPGDWVHLAGVVDPTAGQIRLYVNGTPARDGVRVAGSSTSRWQAQGKFAIGRGWNGAPSERWVGDIDEVHTTPRVWADREIDEKAHIAEDDPDSGA